MRVQHGTKMADKPEGMLRGITFPQLALMDVATGDGRLLESTGAGVRDLPRTIYAQFVNTFGHDAAVIVGRLDTVTFEDDGTVSGAGWLTDDDNGRQMVAYLKSGALRHNSVDLAEVKGHYEYDEETDEFTARFTQWKIAATTFVGKPAFANAYGELDDEIVASWLAEEDDLVIDVPHVFRLALAEPEVVADGSPRPPRSMFTVPEPRKAHPIEVGETDEFGFTPVVGHLGLWDSCHDGIEGRCVRIPRPPDGYASYNASNVLTDNGLVGTGPIFLKNGHRKADDGDFISAYGATENTWCDVRVTEGVFGPWCSGYVRPGTDDLAITAARGSRISGHWKGDRLKAIVSVNVPGYDVPAFGFSMGEDGFIDEMVASFPDCPQPEAPDFLTPVTFGSFSQNPDGTITVTQIPGVGGGTIVSAFSPAVEQANVADETEAALDLALLDMALEDD